MLHETRFPNPCTPWSQNVFPKSQSLESSSSLLCSCLLGPRLSASKESLLIVQIDFQLRLIYCCMIYWAAALPVPLRCWLTGRELPRACTRHSPGEREMLRGYKEAFSAQQLETTDCGPGRGNPLTPPHSLQQLKEGSSPNKSLKWKCEYIRGRRTAAHPHPVHAHRELKTKQQKKRMKYF